MLVLTRKKSESIHLGDDIVIKVVQTGKGAVKIGIEAPSHVRIVRGELAESNGATLEAAIAAFRASFQSSDNQQASDAKLALAAG
ncbi:MAG: hypothetical protein C0478_08990 [Planctomyces sp.]|nr:hypothetical protein [Planctomyces sp.]